MHTTELLHARTRFETTGGRDRPTDRRVTDLRQEIGRLLLRAHAERTEERRSADAAQLAELETALEAHLLDLEIRRGASRAREVAPDGRSTAELLAETGVDLVLDTCVGERATLVFGLAPEGEPRCIEVALGAAELGELVRALRAPAEALRHGELDLAHLDFDVQAARALYAALIAPLADALPPGARLAIVPDGPLSSLPFEALVSGGRTGPFDPERPFAHLASLRFLADDHATTYFSSVDAVLRGGRATPPRSVEVLLAPQGIGVAGAEDEARVIGEAWGRDALRVTRDATPADLAALASSRAALHLVAHGTLDASAPMHGHLLLGDHEAGLSRLEAWQVEELTLASPLVVLSACHAAQGAPLPGAGLLGLTRGFLTAGARQVIASLWTVDDASTVDFMAALHASLARATAAAEALAEARRAVRERGAAHPVQWAGWVLRR